jgi:hypothetical protein
MRIRITDYNKYYLFAFTLLTGTKSSRYSPAGTDKKICINKQLFHNSKREGGIKGQWGRGGGGTVEGEKEQQLNKK